MVAGKSRKGKKQPKQPGLNIRLKRGAVYPVVVRTKHGDIVVRFGRRPDGLCFIDAPKHCCDIILPERRQGQ